MPLGDVPKLTAKKYQWLPKKNPFREDLKISDEDYKVLTQYGLLHPIYVRNYLMKKEYKKLRFDYNAIDSIYKLKDKYPSLEYDVIQKIVMSKIYPKR